MRNANRKYQEVNKEVKRSCREDKRNYVINLAQDAENAAMKGDLGTMYNITRKLGGRSQNTNKPIRELQGKAIKNMKEELKRWKDYFEQVLNRPEPSNLPNLADINVNTQTVPLLVYQSTEQCLGGKREKNLEKTESWFSNFQ